MADLPKGTVTFLFTDIEGSTRLLKQLRDRYADVLAEHQRIVRSAAAEAGGQEVDTQGDAFFVAFASAKDAVSAAVTAQRALADHEWPDGLPVRVRMGVHTGEPTVGEDRYVGMGVHRAARICSAGHGGQVLLSNATRELIEDELPADVRLLDLGEERLKDIDRPERLFQLVVEGLPSEFPRLRTLDAEPAETPFAGREDELARAAEAAVARPRLSRRRALLIGALAGAIAAAVSIPLFALGGESGSDDPATQTKSQAPSVPVSPNSVVVIDPATDAVVDSIPVGSGPGPIAVGEGSVWVANVNDQTVTRIDPTTREVVRVIGLGVEPTDLAVGDGAVWVAAGFDHRLLRIDTADNLVRVRLRVPEKIGPLPEGYEAGWSGVAVGEGAVWLAHGEEVSRIDPVTNEVVATMPAGGTWTTGIEAGEGAVWVQEDGTSLVRQERSDSPDGIVRIDPRTDSVETKIPVEGVASIDVGQGSVWALSYTFGLLWRIDTRSNLAEQSISGIGQSPTVLTLGEPDVWVLDGFELRRIDPFSNQVVATIAVSRNVETIAAGEGALWGTVHR
jgi:YVTN family beta-propeller protein